MIDGWKTYKLGELVDLKQGLAINKKTDHLLCGKRSNSIPLFKIRDLLNNTVEHYVKADEVPKQCIANKEDLIYSRTGQVGYVFKGKEGCVHNNCFKVIPDERLDRGFLFQFLSNPLIRQYANDIASGSVQKDLNHTAFKSIQISIPVSIQEQRAIASIFSALDDKIELNLQQNKTLEEMAMALYKHWFVDFGPFKDGKFIDSELGRIPEGWEVKKLGDFSIIIMGQSPKSEFYNSDRTGLPFHQGVKDFGERFPTDITYTTSGNKIAEVGEILFSVRAPVGRINIAKNKIVLGRGLASLKMKDGNGFLLYSLKNFFQKEDIIGSGTVFNSVNKTEIENIKFVKPNRELLIEFNKKITGIDELIYSNYLENENLKNLRDSLLPKLIIGEIRVKDINEEILKSI